MQDTRPELWSFDRLDAIGGHPVTLLGHPRVVDAPPGKALAFDGREDQLIVRANPMGDARAFTLEVVFRPDAGTLNVANEPRFIHVQDPDDPEQKRLTVEIRMDDRGRWALDSLLLTSVGQAVLFDPALTHPAGRWAHAAVAYDGKSLRTWVDGQEQARGDVACGDNLFGAETVVSVGARMNRKHHLHGMIRALRVTRAVLGPADFLPAA